MSAHLAAPPRRLRAAVHKVLLEAYNANLADLEAHRGALAAGAEALIRQELITGAWVPGLCWAAWFGPCPPVRAHASLQPPSLSLSPSTSCVVGARLTHPISIPLYAGKELEEIMAAHPPVQPESVRQVTAEPLDSLLPA